MKLTKRSVESLAPKDKEFIQFDSELPGFGVRVLTTGRKTFLVQYRQKGRTRRVKIGTFGAVTAEQARQQARAILGDVARGQNPADDIAFDRKAPSVAVICDRFMESHVALHCKPRTAGEYARLVRLYIKPKFGTRRIGDIARPDVAELHHEMRSKPYEANRVLGVLSKLFNLCEVWGLRPDGSNPCRHVPKYPEKKRERFLSRQELADLNATLARLQATGEESSEVCAAIRLLILTGCRLNEIQSLKWEYVEDHYLALPDSKTGARRIPIGKAVHEVLAGLRHDPGNPYIIRGKEYGAHITDLQRPWRRIRKAAGLDDVRIHDLRHTYASHAIANGLALEMVGKLLGHTQIQTTMRYAHLADDAIRRASDQVADALTGAFATSGIEGAPNVVSIAKPAS